jgi:hypothetical protein
LKSGSEKLADARDAILALQGQPAVGKTIRTELGDLAASTETIRARVAEIEDLYAIDFGSDIDDEIQTAARLWREAPAGRILGQDLFSIRRASPLLGTLFRNGIDLKYARKFSDAEMDLARWIGTRFEDMSDLLRAFRKEKRSAKDPSEWSALVPMRRSLRNGLLELVERGIIEGRRLLCKTKKGTWAPFELSWLRDEPETELLVVYRKKDQAAHTFMRGEWLNCYVYGIIEDQLSRREVPFELYTDVSYSAPPDVIRAASEFDVVGRFRDTVICVECKSGRLDAPRGDFDDLVQRAEGVRTVLSSMGEAETQFLFFVVYDPVVNEEAEMRRRLDRHAIQPLKPAAVRSVMAKVLEQSLA